MTAIDVGQSREWLDRLPGGSRSSDYETTWIAFDAEKRPVITIFGAYDTGKSSLIRRLLVDSGLPVPEWLTISARHETFEVNTVDLGGCVIRDTPGIAEDAVDMRGDINSQRALVAMGLTDVGVVMVTPQLATAERESLLGILSQDWPPGSLWFVISRFDEAGVDPEVNLARYQDLAERKRGELRESLGIAPDLRVFVVSQDFAQMAGAASDIEATIWDGSRAWDGMNDVLEAITSVAEGQDPSYRSSAEQRFWRQAVVHEVNGLRSELAVSQHRASTAAVGLNRREVWLGQLDELDKGAQADLQGQVGETVRVLMLKQARDPDEISAELRASLQLWFEAHNHQLDVFLQEIDVTVERERRTPEWQDLEELASSIADDGRPSDRASASPWITPIVGRTGPKLLKALRDFDRARPKPKRQVADPKKWTFGHGVGAASAILPVALDLSRLIEKHIGDSAAQMRQREALKASITGISESAARLALDSWHPQVELVRDSIMAATAEADLLEEFHATVTQLTMSIESGETLLGREDEPAGG